MRAPDADLPPGEFAGLREFLAAVPDPRRRRGVRHTLASALLTSVAAVLASARSFAAIGEWAAEAPPEVLAALGVRFDPSWPACALASQDVTAASRLVASTDSRTRRILASPGGRSRPASSTAAYWAI